MPMPSRRANSSSSSKGNNSLQSESFADLFLHLFTWNCKNSGKCLLYSGLRKKKKRNSGRFSMAKLLLIADQKRGELSSYEENSRNINSSSTVASLSSASTDSPGRRSPGVVARLMGIEFFPDMKTPSEDDIDNFHPQHQTKPQPLKRFLKRNGKLPSLIELFEEESTEMEEASVSESREDYEQEIMAAATSRSVFKQPFPPEHLFPSDTLPPLTADPIRCQIQPRNDSKLRALSRMPAVPWCLSLPRGLSQLARRNRSQSRVSWWDEVQCRKNALYLEDYLQDPGSSSKSSSTITISDEAHSSDLKTDSELSGDVCKQQYAEQLHQPSDRKSHSRHALAIGMLPAGLYPEICREEYEKTTDIKLKQGKPKANPKYHQEDNRAKKQMGDIHSHSASASEERGPQHQFGLKGCKSNATGTVKVDMNIFHAESYADENLKKADRSSPVAKGLLLRSKSIREGGSHMQSLSVAEISIPMELQTKTPTELRMNQQAHLASNEISLPEKRESNQERDPVLHAVSYEIRHLSLKKPILQQESHIIEKICSDSKSAGAASKGSSTSLLLMENLRNASRNIPARVPRKIQVFGVSKEVRAWIEEEERKIAEHMQKKPHLTFSSPVNNPKLLPGKIGHNNIACFESRRKEEMLQTCLDGSTGTNVTSDLKIGEALAHFQQKILTQTNRMEHQQTGLGFDNWPRIISILKTSSENRECTSDGSSSKSNMHLGSKKDHEDTAIYGMKGIKSMHYKGCQIISGKQTARSFRAQPFLPKNNTVEIRKTLQPRQTSSTQAHGYEAMFDSISGEDIEHPSPISVLDPHVYDKNLTSKKISRSPQGECQLQPLDAYVKRLQTSYAASSSLLAERCNKYHSDASEKLQFEQRMEDFFPRFRGISSEEFAYIVSLEQYVVKVLTVAGLLSENHQQSLPNSSKGLVIHPKLFDRLEIQRRMQGALKALECSPPEDAIYALELHYERCQSSRAHYKLLFDCINESLNLSMHRFLFHDTKMILPESMPRLSGKHLVDEVITSIWNWKEVGIETADENWSDLRQEIAGIVQDTECMLLEDVLDEITLAV